MNKCQFINVWEKTYYYSYISSTSNCVSLIKINHHFLPLFCSYMIKKLSARLEEWKGSQHPWNSNPRYIKTLPRLWRHSEFKGHLVSFALSLSGEHIVKVKMEYGWKQLKGSQARRRDEKEDPSSGWALGSVLPTKSRSPEKGRGDEQGRRTEVEWSGFRREERRKLTLQERRSSVEDPKERTAY